MKLKKTISSQLLKCVRFNRNKFSLSNCYKVYKTHFNFCANHLLPILISRSIHIAAGRHSCIVTKAGWQTGVKMS